MSELSKLDALLYKTHINVLLVLTYQGSTCVDPYIYIYIYYILLSKTAHQVWYDHPFSQRSMTTERTVGVGDGCDREVEGWGGGLGGWWTKFEKGG